MDEIGVIRILAQNSRRVIAVMDSSKLGQCSKCMALSPEQVDLLLMDDHIPPEVKEKYRSKGIEIQICKNRRYKTCGFLRCFLHMFDLDTLDFAVLCRL